MYHLICTNFTVNSVEARNLASKTFSLVKTKQRFFYLCLLAMLSLFAFNDANAQATFVWDCSTSAATSGTLANLTVGSFSQGNNLGTTTMISTSSPSSGTGAYSGNSGTSNFGAAARVGAINIAASGSAYFEVTLTPATGYLATVIGLSLGSRGTGTGPLTLGLRTSADNYAANIATATVLANSSWALNTFSVTSTSGAGNTPLTLRIYGYGGAGSPTSGTANWRIDDIKLTVNVSSAELAPATPTSGGNQSICLGATVPSLSATAPSGAVVDWYAAPTGGSAISSGSNTYSTGATTAGTYTFYAESRNSPGSLVSSTRTPVTLTINPVVTPAISASVDDNTPAPGQTVNFSTSGLANGGSSPSYQWYKNSSPIGGATSPTYSTNSNYATGDVFYVVLTSNANCASPTTVQSSNITITIDNSACSGTPPTTSASASSTSICSGGSSNLSLIGLGGQTGYTFQWQSSSTQNGTYADINGETNATYAATNIISAAWYRCVVTCTNSSLFTNSNAVQINVTANVAPSVTIAANTNPSCAGSSVTYTATPTNGGGSPVYAWYLNNNLVTGQTAATYTSSSFANGDQVYAVITSNYACLSSNNISSNTATQSVIANVAASVSIVSSVNPSCAGASVTFTATPTNGGTTPTYQWYNGANPISGETNATYTSSLITTGSSITVRMTSNATCVSGSPATSNAVVQTVTANVTPSLTVASNNNPVCLSGNAIFNINPVNPGTTPVYAWYLNGSIVSGQTGTTYTLSPVTNGDSVYATMSSSLTCVTTASATSNVVKETVVSQSTPIVSIAANPGTSIFDGTNITFTATPTFGGTTPVYQWKLNGANVGTGLATYSSSTLSNADVVSCAMVSNYTCATSTNATSNNLTITILSANPFTPGNILVYKVGDSATTLSANGSAIFLNEYTTSGTFVQSKRLSRTTSGVTTILSAATSNSEGYISLNTDGSNVAVGGYNTTTTNTTALSGSSAATIKRIVALVDRNQNVDTTTKLKDVSGNIRSVVVSGNKIFASSSSNGARYALKGDTVSTQLSTAVSNLRNLGIFNGQLYTSTSSGVAVRLGAIGTGLPSTSAQTITNIPGFATSTGSPYGFYFADLSSSVAGVDVVYVADDGTNTITKYSLVSGSWTSNGSISASGVRGITGSVFGTSVKLFATGAITSPAAGTFVFTYTDNTGYNSAISGTATTIVDRSSVSLIAFRGLAFAPTAITSQPTNAFGCTGTTSTFSVTMATGTSASIYTYQWQSSTDGTNWSNLMNAAPYSNATTATLTITNPSLSLNNTQYRCVVTYMGNTTLTSNAATFTVNQTFTPSVSISTAKDTVCSGNNVAFTASAINGGSSPNYQWKKNGVNAGSGSTITFLPNTLSNGDVISCVLTANNICQTSATVTSNAITMTVKQSPSVAPINNGISTITSISLCTLGSTYKYYNATPYGTWSSSNPTVASITGVSQAGSVTANTNGTATISYNIAATNGCISTSSILVTAAQQTAPSAISGINIICVGATTTLSSTAPVGTTGVWSSSNNLGTINVSGVYTGTNAGTYGEAKYTVTNASGCTAFASKTIVVNPTPVVPTITFAPGTVVDPRAGAPSGGFCIGKKFRVAATPNVPAGVWSATGAASIAGYDTVKINAVGAGSIKYTYTSAAGCVNSRTMSASGYTCAARGVSASGERVVVSGDFTMYPNPAKGLINLHVETLVGAGSIVVTDLYGKSVKNQALSMGSNTVNISNLSKGFYLVSVITSEGKTTKKLVVE